MRKASNLTGVAAMLAATTSFVVGDSFMKLVANDLPPFEVLFLRGVAASIACGLLLVVLGDWRVVSSALHPRALLRAVGETLSVLCYIVALAGMPIADVIAILQTAPLILILAVAFLLRERVGAARVALALVGFAGAFLVAQPGPAGISPAALLAFASALLIAARDLVGRDVPACIPVMVVTFATNVMVMVVAAVLMSLGLESWQAPMGWHLAFLSFAGLFVTLGHVGLLLAYRLGRTAAVAPFFYSFALWAVLSGLLVFGVLPNALALVGIALIAGSGVAIVLLDQRRGEEIALTEAL
jgi:drug/metabolite transporter (DMT)-like permease